MKKPIILSLGHSNYPMIKFMDILKKNKIEVIIDARTYPVSRFCPHFSKMPLQEALERETIKYLWRGKNIGGRSLNVNYDETIKEIVEIAKKFVVCVICSEKSYTNCHRFILLEPSFREVGAIMKHI